ncbi:MAG: prepilin-type N-terminal cleavage/methylation domain-containing protein [Oscillospiraceae bacterium]|nr:prepilin-type N-terminal cleavage/methylation domain-containing protein [Oscillospiraceae bacterium]
MKLKGFTLIEMIVVIAIIGALAAIIVPSIFGYVRDANIAAANRNAKCIYISAKTEIINRIANEKESPKGGTIFTGGNDGLAKGSDGTELDLLSYVGSNFSGYYLFVVSEDGQDIEYTLWCNEAPPVNNGKMSPKQIRDSQPLTGCYPEAAEE